MPDYLNADADRRMIRLNKDRKKYAAERTIREQNLERLRQEYAVAVDHAREVAGLHKIGDASDAKLHAAQKARDQVQKLIEREESEIEAIASAFVAMDRREQNIRADIKRKNQKRAEKAVRAAGKKALDALESMSAAISELDAEQKEAQRAGATRYVIKSELTRPFMLPAKIEGFPTDKLSTRLWRELKLKMIDGYAFHQEVSR